MSKAIETYLPVFPGFYGTIFEPNSHEESEVEHINEQREELKLQPITWDACKFDYPAYRVDVAKKVCPYIEKELNDIFTSKIAVTYQDIHSPREYNFSNDSINVAIEIKTGFKTELIKYLLENNEAFTTYIKDRFTHRSGFYSFYSNNPVKWVTEYMEKLATDKTVLGALLDFVCENEDINTEGMYGYLTDHDLSIEATNYEELTTK